MIFASNWPVVVFASAIVWTLLHFAAPVFSAKFSASYRGLDEGKRADWDTRIVGFVHALVSSTGALCVVASVPSSILEDPISGYSEESQFVIAISTGYFAWDAAASIFGGWDTGFIVHGVVCFCVYLACSWPQPFSQFAAVVFLLYELSTPFMHIRQFCVMAKATDSLTFQVANVMFPLTFFVVRLCGGFAFSYWWALKVWTFVNNVNAEPFMRVVSLLVFCANIILNCLNIYWFGIIVQKGLQRGKSSKQSKE